MGASAAAAVRAAALLVGRRGRLAAAEQGVAAEGDDGERAGRSVIGHDKSLPLAPADRCGFAADMLRRGAVVGGAGRSRLHASPLQEPG